MRKEMLCLVSLVVVLALWGATSAATVTIETCDDAYVGRWYDWPYTTQYYASGSDEKTWSSYFHLQGYRSYHHVSYLKFDLGGLSDNFDMTSAVLNLYAAPQGSSVSPAIYHADDNWDEDTIRYDTTPTNQGMIAETGTWTGAASEWVSFDLTGWDYAVDLQDDFLTIMIGPNGSSHLNFSTKEYLDGSYAPYIEIQGVPEPTTMVLFGLGGLMCARRRKNA